MRRLGPVHRPVALLLALACGACAFGTPPPPVETSRVVAQTPGAALDRARHWLHAHGFVIEKDHRRRDGGRLAASQTPFEEGGYARCAWSFVLSGGAQPAAEVVVLATQDRPGRTRVETHVEISLVNGFGDRALCASQGRLEREILTAIAAGR